MGSIFAGSTPVSSGFGRGAATAMSAPSNAYWSEGLASHAAQDLNRRRARDLRGQPRRECAERLVEAVHVVPRMLWGQVERQRRGAGAFRQRHTNVHFEVSG